MVESHQHSDSSNQNTSRPLTLYGHGFTIRQVRPDELPAILQVYRQCEDFLALGPQATASEAMVQGDLELSRQEGGVYCGIYDDQGAMIGVVDVVFSGYEQRPAHADLALLMIGAPYRGRGIGAEVVALVEEEILRNPEVNAICSGVQVNNPGAIRFWDRHGYRIIGGPELMPDQTTVYHLCKTVR